MITEADREGSSRIWWGNKTHFHLHLSLARRNAKIGKVPPYFFHQIRRGTTNLNRETIEIEALGHSVFFLLLEFAYWGIC